MKKKKEKIHPNDWINLATAYLYIIIYLVFIANWAKAKKQPNLRKNIKWKQLRRKKKRT